MGIVTVDKLENADKDADALDTFINGADTATVTTRKSKKYPTLANAVKQVIETGGFEPFATESALLASRPTITKKAAKALDTKKVWLWDGSKWNDTGLSELDIANSLTKKEIVDRASLIKPTEVNGYTDKYGFYVNFFELKNSILELYKDVSTDRLRTKDIYINDHTLMVTDKYGFTFDLAKPQITSDIKTNINDILFVNKLTNWADVKFSINVAHVLIDRQIQIENKPIVMAWSSENAEFSSKNDELVELPETKNIEGQINFYFRNKVDFVNRARLPITVTSVPNSSNNDEIKILMIGDSNTYRGATAVVKHMLERRGFKPSFIGTFNGSSETYKGQSLPVQPAEARGGIGIPGLTYMSTSRWKPVDNLGASTDSKAITVDAYLALNNTGRDSCNPMLRKATDADNPDFVQNGYIFDVADYLNKFSFDTPDVVYFSVGGNEINSLEVSEMKQKFSTGLEIILSQIRTALPNVKIILGHNAPAYTYFRDADYWTNYIVEQFKIKRELARKYNAHLLNTHVLDIGEAAYALTINSTSAYGLQQGTFEDGTHYQKATRFKIYDYVAANIAAAKLNLI